MEEKRKYLEYFDGPFDSTVAKKRKPENKPYVAYSKTEGAVVYTVVPKIEGVYYDVTELVKKSIPVPSTGYGEVDLGLSVIWADRNVGAETPQDNGAYFSWGNVEGVVYETTKKSEDDVIRILLIKGGISADAITQEMIDNIKLEAGENLKPEIERFLEEYILISGTKFDENTYSTSLGGQYTGSILDAEHDAATVNIGDTWRMPTIEEYQELIKAVKSSDGTKGTLTCQYEYIDLNGEQQSLVVYNNGESGYFSVEGLMVDGSPIFKTILGIRFTNVVTGNSVYFPACGGVEGSILAGIGFNGSYWSSSVGDTTIACNFLFDPSCVDANTNLSRYCGMCVRAVK